MYTISFHHGAQVSLEHNRRNKKVVSKEDHIDPKGQYEIWQNEDVRQAYKKVFGKAQEEYNLKQTRDSRKILNYYDNILQSSKKENGRKPLYEAIITIGNVKNKPSDELSHKILKDYFQDFKKRNPNLYVVGAYYHADEPGAAPHVHLDYFPIARGYKRGMSVQNGLNKALEQQGLKSQNKSKTAIIQWQDRERAELERLARSRGLEIKKPTEEKRKHYATQDYKLKTKIQDLQKTVSTFQSERDKARSEAKKAQEALEQAKNQLHEYKRKSSVKAPIDMAQKLNDLRLENKKLASANAKLTEEINFRAELGSTITLPEHLYIGDLETYIQKRLEKRKATSTPKDEPSFFDNL